MIYPPIREDLLHYVWRLKRFNHNALVSTDQDEIEIIDYGRYNVDAGPDFLEGKVKINGVLWIGQIEMHVRSSDWYLHKHEQDPAYDNVILHVVYDDDRPVNNRSNQRIPTLVLNDRIDPYVRKHYSQLIQSQSWIPCEPLIQDVDPFKVELWLNSLSAERLESKSQYCSELLMRYNGDWERTLFAMVCMNLGLKVNVLPFESLADSFPFTIFHKICDNPLAIAALLFGQAGFLHQNREDDIYYISLRKEYLHLKHKYNLSPIDAVMWKFSKMRPTSFPTIRLAQLAILIGKETSIFQYVRDKFEVKELRHILQVTAPTYWNNRYHFHKVSNASSPKKIGKGTIDLLIINSIIPVAFRYGLTIADYSYCEYAISLLESLGAEKNHITRGFKSLGVLSTNARQSQALIHLKTRYCDHKRCMSCTIGHQIMKE